MPSPWTICSQLTARSVRPKCLYPVRMSVPFDHILEPPRPPPDAVIEVMITSQGEIPLPKALRTHLGRPQSLHPAPCGGFCAHPVLSELEDLSAVADQTGKPGPAMSFDEMNRAKGRGARR